LNNKYLKYSFEELLDDRDFISWVLHGTRQKDWEAFLNENHDLRGRALKAKKIISLLKDTGEELTEENILDLWHHIDRFDNQHRPAGRVIRLRTLFRVAAVFLLVTTLGAVGYFYLSVQPQPYEFVSDDPGKTGGDARLVLSTGDEISLKKDNSSIALTADEQLRINNDSVIDLRGKAAGITEPGRMNEVIVPFGKKSQLVLEDGTKVWLNAGSRFAFPTRFTGKKREVVLEGEAYFEVAKSSERPFLVNAGEVSVRVLGTRFNLSAYPTDGVIEAMLVEGSVAMTEKSGPGFSRKEVVIIPNQLGSFNRTEKSMVVRNEPDTDIYIAWTEGWFQFSKEDLFTVFKKLERFYDVKFVYPSDFNSPDLISGKLDLKDTPEQVMRALADVARIEYRIENNYIRVTKTMKPLPMKN